MSPVAWMLLGVVLHLHLIYVARRQVARWRSSRAKRWTRWITLS